MRGQIAKLIGKYSGLVPKESRHLLRKSMKARWYATPRKDRAELRRVMEQALKR